jgi:hypothetical protein
VKTAPPQIPTALGWNPTGDFGPWTFYTAHDRRPVFYDRAPPTKPPTWKQRRRITLFRLAAKAWRNLTPELRARWELAAKRAHLRITGYNLWTYVQTTGNRAPVRTVERLSGLQLIPP